MIKLMHKHRFSEFPAEFWISFRKIRHFEMSGCG